MIRPLMQERFSEPWQVLVGCILLNKTSGKQAIPVAEILFNAYPTPYDLHRAEFATLVSILRPLGFQNQRAITLIRFATEWLRLAGSAAVPPDDYMPITSLPGVGEYAWEAWRIFVLGETDFRPNDRILAEYLTGVER